jgi:hypothetical protein
MCDPFYFDGITTESFSKVKADLAAAGFDLTSTSGTVSGPYGIVISYEWNESTQSLKVVVLEKSFFVTCGQIHDKLTSALQRYASRVG